MTDERAAKRTANTAYITKVMFAPRVILPSIALFALVLIIMITLNIAGNGFSGTVVFLATWVYLTNKESRRTGIKPYQNPSSNAASTET